MKKFVPLIALALTLSLALPVLAYEDTDPPQWEQFGYASLEEMLRDFGITEEAYYEYYVQPELEWEQQLQEQRNLAEAWLKAHPEEAAAFDPYAYFAEEFDSYYGSPEIYMLELGLGEDGFRQQMLLNWAMEQAEWEAFISAHPEEYAAFDPYAYFAQDPYYSYAYDTPEEYMSDWGLTEEAFRQEMLGEWMWYIEEQEAEEEFRANEKELYGGSRDGINVRINDRCVPFPDVRPELTGGRTMVPLAPVMEYLGAQVSYSQQDHSVSISMDGRTLYHQIGTTQLTVSGGGEDDSSETITMDVSSYTRDGRTMVPVAFFAQALGYEVFWDDLYQTAVLLDRQEAVDRIDQEFTLLNRLLYALSGEGVVPEGRSQMTSYDMEYTITLLDSLNGDKTYSFTLDGDSLSGQQADNTSLSMDLAGLMDLYRMEASSSLTEEELAELDAYLELFSSISIDVITDYETQRLYLRCPLLAQLGLMEDPEAWAVLPAGDPDELSGQPLTVGTLSAYGTDFGLDPFHAWDSIVNPAAVMLEAAGDDRFVKSGSSYTLSWSEESPYYNWYGSSGTQTADLSLHITPVGDQSCRFTFSLTEQSPDERLTCTAEGASGRLDLEAALSMKNAMDSELTMSIRITPSNQAPDAAPPEGDPLEYPAGLLGSNSL